MAGQVVVAVCRASPGRRALHGERVGESVACSCRARVCSDHLDSGPTPFPAALLPVMLLRECVRMNRSAPSRPSFWSKPLPGRASDGRRRTSRVRPGMTGITFCYISRGSRPGKIRGRYVGVPHPEGRLAVYFVSSSLLAATASKPCRERSSF